MPATTEAARDARRNAAARLDDAYQAFAHDNGDGFGGYDYIGAYDYREEGYGLALKAWSLPEARRSDFIEGAVEAYPDSARYLVSAAAAFRLAELADRRADAALAQRAAA